MIFFCFCFQSILHPDISIISGEKSLQRFPTRVIAGEEIHFVLCAVQCIHADLSHVHLRWRSHSLRRSLR